MVRVRVLLGTRKGAFVLSSDGTRRIRFFAAGRDISHDPLDTPLPPRVLIGSDAFCVVGAIPGG